ncbi:sugar transferase [uncultured Polaribacter sp.]|uniref:sugar transferase n=1 Tax=uncultured Polaribacter sp. TaxID=174711 RepID=UPI00345B6331
MVPILMFFLILIILLLVIYYFKSCFIFTQTRIGQYGKPFSIYKIKTMQNGVVTPLGKFLRKTKLDELPQLINILKGEMSFVGPRPDIPGYYDTLEGENRKILELKPGLTSLAALKYKNEERILAQQKKPKEYNDYIIFPDKVKMNLEYYYKKNLLLDIQIIIKTIFNK